MYAFINQNETNESAGAEFARNVRQLCTLQCSARQSADVMFCASSAPGSSLLCWLVVRVAGGAPCSSLMGDQAAWVVTPGPGDERHSEHLQCHQCQQWARVSQASTTPSASRSLSSIKEHLNVELIKILLTRSYTTYETPLT